MKAFASLVGLLFLLALPQAVRAERCVAPGHPSCHVSCPKQCEARWTDENSCHTRCGPPQRDPHSGLPTGNGHEEIVSPRDPQSGLPTGQRLHGQMEAEKRCYSSEFQKKAAQNYCQRQLNCSNGFTCQHDPEKKRWVCWCE